MPEAADGWDVVLSYGDLSRTSGYRTRVLGEFAHLDRHSGLDPFLLLLDRDPELFRREAPRDLPFQVLLRGSVRDCYREIGKLAAQKPIRIVHAHNLYSAALALSARWRHRYRVILDYHGRIPEEYVYLGKGGNRSRKLLELLEGWAVRSADHTVVVSEKLREYLQKKYRTRPEKLSVIPCATDGTQFRWNYRIRADMRARLGLTDKFVCTHVGSFFEWYDPELIVEAYRQIRAFFKNTHLLVLTNDPRGASEYLNAQFHPAQFSVISVGHPEVPYYLNAADVGFLLLKRSPNIYTSSPVKFAEYLNCGVPVVMSAGVGDYSELVETTQTGVIMTPGEPLDMRKINVPREEIAARCVAAGCSLTWTAVRETWNDALQRASAR